MCRDDGLVTDGQESIPLATSLLLAPQPRQTPQSSSIFCACRFPTPNSSDSPISSLFLTVLLCCSTHSQLHHSPSSPLLDPPHLLLLVIKGLVFQSSKILIPQIFTCLSDSLHRSQPSFLQSSPAVLGRRPTLRSRANSHTLQLKLKTCRSEVLDRFPSEETGNNGLTPFTLARKRNDYSKLQGYIGPELTCWLAPFSLRDCSCSAALRRDYKKNSSSAA